MKTKILSILAIAAATVGLGACSETWEPKTDKTGDVALSSLGIEIAGDEQVVESRAEYDLNPFIVTVFDENGAQKEQWTYGSMPEIMTLPVGKYTVRVESHDVLDAEWSHPYYAGEKTFEVEKSKITDIGVVTCKFSSLKVSIFFADDLRQVMADDVQVKVVAGETGELVFTPSETRSGYFKVVEDSPTMVATFTGTVNGYKENIIKTYDAIKGGQHYRITFKLKQNKPEPDEETGLIDPTEGINVDTEATRQDISGNATTEEEVIGEDDLEQPGKEEFKSKVAFETLLKEGIVYNPAEVVDAAVKVLAPNGIADLAIAVASDNDECKAATVDLTAFGLPAAAQAVGQTELNIDFKQLLTKLAEYTGNHTVSLSVTDTQNNNLAAAYNFAVKGEEEPEAIDFVLPEGEGEDKKEGIMSINTPMNPMDVTNGLLTIVAPAGIEKLVVDITSDDTDFAGVTSMISGKDFAHPGDLKETLDGFGLANGDAVLGQTSVDFDITNFLGLLPGFHGKHTFTLNVTDKDGNERSASLIFVTE